MICERDQRCLMVLAAAVLCTACTTRSWYDGQQYSQRQQCQKIDHRAERARCEQAASLSHGDYRTEAAAAKRR